MSIHHGPSAPREDELERLLSRLCDDTLTPAELQRLNDRLATDPQARRDYLAYVDLHAALLSSLMLSPAVLPEPVPARVHPWTWQTVRTAALAGALLTLVVTALWAWKPRGHQVAVQPVSLGTLTVLDGSGEWHGPDGIAAAAVGDPLRLGSALQTSDDGLAVITLSDGSQLELSPAARLRLPADPVAKVLRFELEAGLIQANVQPRPAGHPLLVTTAQVEVVVLGTQFCVSAAQPAATGVETESGLVRVRRMADGQSVEVPPGHFTVTKSDPPTGNLPGLDVRRRLDLSLEPKSTFELEQVRSLAFTADGAWLTVVSNRTWTCLDLATGTLRFPPQAVVPKSEVYAVSTSGLHFLTHGRTGPIGFYDVSAGQLLQRTRFNTTARSAWALDRDARRAVFGLNVPETGNPLTLWDPAAAQAVDQIPLAGAVTAVALTDEGDLAAVGLANHMAVPDVPTVNQQLQLWRLSDRQRLATIDVPQQLQLLQFSRDGTRLVGIVRGGGVLVWDVPNTRLLAQRDATTGWTQPIGAVAFSPRGDRLALGLANGRVRLWDVPHDRELGLLQAGKHAVSALAFSPDGRTLATCVLRGRLQLWDLPPLDDHDTR